MIQQELLAYPLILTEYNNDGRYYVVTSPNIKGMVTDGDTIAKALFHAEDAMATMLDGTIVQRNISLPEGLNNWAKENKINVSQVTANALRKVQEA